MPFFVDNAPAGTVWVVAHDESREFDREDERIIKTLAQFAAIAWQLSNARRDDQRKHHVEQSVQRATSHLEIAHQRVRETQVLSALGTTVAKIIHDLANPLNSIATAVHLLEFSLGRNGERQQMAEALQDIKEENARVRELIEELRQFARPLGLSRGTVNMTNMLAEVVREVSALCSPDFIEIAPRLAEDLPMVNGDGAKLRRVFLNLCKNSLEAMPSGGKLVIDAYAGAENITVEVQDTGVGIPKEMDIFEPFTTSKRAGWGLGLSIVRQITLAHGGTIDYVSESGKGTKFTVCFPSVAVEDLGN